MAIGAALALLAGAGSGYMRQLRENEDAARRKEDDEWRREQRARQRTEWQQSDEESARKKAEREAVSSAMAPVKADASPVAAPIGSRDEPRAPEDQGIRVAGQTFTDPVEASRATEAANALPARMSRAAAATTDPEAAARFQSLGQQAEVTGMQATAAKEAAANRAKLQDIVGTLASGGIQAIPQVYGRYNDGMSAEVVPGENGAFTVRRIDKDGKPAGDVQFRDMQDFIGRAVARMNPELYITSEQARAKAERDQANADRDYTLRKTDVETRAAREDRMARAAEAQARAAQITAQNSARRGTGESQPVGLNMADADKFINGLFTTKDEMTGKTVFDPKGAQAVRTLMPGMPAAQNGDTQGAVNQSLMVYNRYLALAKGDHDEAMKLIDQAVKAQKAAPAPASPAKTARAPAAQAAAASSVPKSQFALRAPVPQLSRDELVAIKPGHPSYVPAQEELARRAATASEQARQSDNFERGY